MAASKKTHQASGRVSCRQMTDLVFDYANDQLSPGMKRDFQRHLRICPDCVSFLNTYKKTVAATRCVRPEDIPTKVRTNILEFLRRRTRLATRSRRRSTTSHASGSP